MNRPKVVMLNTASVDGRLAASRDVLLLHGDQRWQTMEQWSPAPEGGQLFEWLKAIHKPQATLEGSGSFVKDEDTPAPLPLLEGHEGELYQDFLPQAVIHRSGHRGWFTAVDGRGRIRWLYGAEYPDEAWKGWHALVWVGDHTPPEYLAYLRRENIPYLVAASGKGRVDLALALEKMKSLLGVGCILSTAGGRLNGALLHAGLLDEVNIEFLPAVIGGFDTPALFDSPGLEAAALPVRLKLIQAQVRQNGRVWLRYEVERD